MIACPWIKVHDNVRNVDVLIKIHPLETCYVPMASIWRSAAGARVAIFAIYTLCLASSAVCRPIKLSEPQGAHNSVTGSRQESGLRVPQSSNAATNHSTLTSMPTATGHSLLPSVEPPRPASAVLGLNTAWRLFSFAATATSPLHLPDSASRQLMQVAQVRTAFVEAPPNSGHDHDFHATVIIKDDNDDDNDNDDAIISDAEEDEEAGEGENDPSSTLLQQSPITPTAFPPATAAATPSSNVICSQSHDLTPQQQGMFAGIIIGVFFVGVAFGVAMVAPNSPGSTTSDSTHRAQHNAGRIMGVFFVGMAYGVAMVAPDPPGSTTSNSAHRAKHDGRSGGSGGFGNEYGGHGGHGGSGCGGGGHGGGGDADGCSGGGGDAGGGE